MAKVMRKIAVGAARCAIFGTVLMAMSGCGNKESTESRFSPVATTANASGLTPVVRSEAPAQAFPESASEILAWDYLFANVDGFYDADDDAGMNALMTASPGGKGRLSAGSTEDWGKSVVFDSLHINYTK